MPPKGEYLDFCVTRETAFGLVCTQRRGMAQNLCFCGFRS